MTINVRQVFIANIVNYLGLLVSTVGFFYVFSGNKETYGYLQFLLSTGAMLIPLTNLGINNLPVRYHGIFENRRLASLNFYQFLVAISIIVFAVTSSLLYLLHKPLLGFLAQCGFDIGLLTANALPIASIAFFVSLITLTSKYLTNFQQVALPALIHLLGNKVVLLCLVLSSSYAMVAWRHLALYYVLFFALVSVILFFYTLSILRKKRPPSTLAPLPKGIWQEVISYSLYTNLSQIGSLLVYRIDAFMISTNLGVGFTGTYMLLLFIANVIKFPVASISSLAGPIIAKAWQEGDIARIGRLYKSTSTTLTLYGISLVALIWFNLPLIFSLAKNGETLYANRYVFLLLATSQLWDMVTSVNAQILSYTSIYRWNLYFMIFLGILNSGGNYYLMTHLEYGILGAALATAITMLFYNSAKLALIYAKFDIHPFSRNTPRIFLISSPLFIAPLVIQYFSSLFWLPGIVCGFLVIGYYFPILFFLKIDTEFNKLIDRLKKQVISRLK